MCALTIAADRRRRVDEEKSRDESTHSIRARILKVDGGFDFRSVFLPAAQDAEERL